MKAQRRDKIADQIAQLAAEFVQRESNKQSLITVTRADTSPDLARATVYVTVLPDEHEESALSFLKRQRADFRTHLKTHTKLRRLPFVDFAIDRGEKHRQHLDTLSQQ